MVDVDVVDGLQVKPIGQMDVVGTVDVEVVDAEVVVDDVQFPSMHIVVVGAVDVEDVVEVDDDDGGQVNPTGQMDVVV